MGKKALPKAQRDLLNDIANNTRIYDDDPFTFYRVTINRKREKTIRSSALLGHLDIVDDNKRDIQVRITNDGLRAIDTDPAQFRQDCVTKAYATHCERFTDAAQRADAAYSDPNASYSDYQIALESMSEALKAMRKLNRAYDNGLPVRAIPRMPYAERMRRQSDEFRALRNLEKETIRWEQIEDRFYPVFVRQGAKFNKELLIARFGYAAWTDDGSLYMTDSGFVARGVNPRESAAQALAPEFHYHQHRLESARSQAQNHILMGDARAYDGDRRDYDRSVMTLTAIADATGESASIEPFPVWDEADYNAALQAQNRADLERERAEHDRMARQADARYQAILNGRAAPVVFRASVLQDKFLTAIKTIAKIAPKMAYIDARDDHQIVLCAMDPKTDKWVRIPIQAKVDRKGIGSFNVKTFKQYVPLLPPDRVDLVGSSAGDVEIRCGTSCARIFADPSVVLPAWEDEPYEATNPRESAPPARATVTLFTVGDTLAIVGANGQRFAVVPVPHGIAVYDANRREIIANRNHGTTVTEYAVIIRQHLTDRGVRFAESVRS